ncbi:MAG: N-acetylglucosamine-1-phosphate uridyltransferase [Oscillospiraceae bacterium]|nr:N-acetylglucosamine-1-phosphate uridyltransferase [Oscillospiraceae bacterium]
MQKKLSAVLTAAALCSSMLSAMPAPAAAAAGEYLIRDKWGYCTSANYVESEHFVIFYGNNDTTGQVNDAFLQRNLADYEKLWKCYGEYLGMENMNVDIYGRSTQKYKTNIYLTYTGLDQYPDGWAFMSAEDGYGIEIISPNAMLDDLTIAHEFGHVVTMQQKAWVDQDITGAWWEPLANWFREMYLYSDYYTGNTKTCWFEPYIRNMSLTLPHGRNYYEVWPFLVYLSYNPDNLPGLGITSVQRIISEAKANEYPMDTITRLFGTDAQTVFGHYAKRMATFDFGAQDAYRSEFNKKLSDSKYYWNLFYTVPEDSSTGWLTVPEEDAPMQTGINIVPLQITGDSISVNFKGLSDDANAGWKACIVTVDASGNETYSDLFGDGDSMTVSAAGAASAYLTVAGTPKKFNAVNAFHKDNVSSYKSGTERRRYPYAVQLSGAAVIPQATTYAKGSGHAHPNGGGWVANGATVADSVYVGPNAMVLGTANISGNVRIEDYAIVAGSATVRDNAVISGHAIVDGGGMIYDNGWKFGSVTVSGNAVISDSAVVSGLCEISGNARILQKAYLTENVKVSDEATVKGMSYCYGKGNYSGQAILDGDYANEETRSSGISFGWLDDTVSRQYTDGMMLGYDFANESAVWAADKHTATDALLSGAEWQSERTSAKGVVSFSGSGDALLLDNSFMQTQNLQISLAALWKGGTAQQELFRFGDEKAAIAFTPSNQNGVAELTVTDGSKTETLTASAPLAKGEWSKITVQIINGTGTLLINGQQAASKSLSLTPVDVMCAAEQDLCTVGGSFKGAVDYVNFYFQQTAEPTVTYSGKEEADDTDPGRVRGDVDANGKFERADVIMMQQYLLGAGTLTDWEAGDMDGSGKISTADLSFMQREIVR